MKNLRKFQNYSCRHFGLEHWLTRALFRVEELLNDEWVWGAIAFWVIALFMLAAAKILVANC